MYGNETRSSCTKEFDNLICSGLVPRVLWTGAADSVAPPIVHRQLALPRLDSKRHEAGESWKGKVDCDHKRFATTYDVSGGRCQTSIEIIPIILSQSKLRGSFIEMDDRTAQAHHNREGGIDTTSA